ncbi:MAG: PLP-dependent aminotransferase family protein [Saprospiraceae bacterium]|nr:PLP-dependent aminotransferase family protein [Saprospiraceae bacterium]
MILELIKIDRNADKPIFRQLIDQIIQLVRDGVLPSGFQLPGTRQLSQKLLIHRKTAIAAIDELVAQGWLETIPGRGTFVAKEIAVIYDQLPKIIECPVNDQPIIVPTLLNRQLQPNFPKYHLDDGLPDPRLAPVDELTRAYKNALTKGWRYPKYTYGDPKGQLLLRDYLKDYLAKTRGMHVDREQILITRGVTQALYLTIKAFIQKGDQVAVGALSWESANVNFLYHGAKLIKIRVDSEGLDVDHLEEVCQQSVPKMVYVTPHQQYPTTVIMPAYRRVKILQLANKYGFFVFEDDYDYDFHYTRHPIMPLTSADNGGRVFYTGSFTKAISPVFRVGYLVATIEQVDFLAKLRRLVDRQGDAILELVIAELLKTDVIQRYLRRNRKIYQERRDYFGHLLQANFADVLEFTIPEGGMSVWTKFPSEVSLPKLARKALNHDLYFYNGASFKSDDPQLNATRLGFASSTHEELEIALKILKRLL